MVVKSDGGYNYDSTDLAALKKHIFEELLCIYSDLNFLVRKVKETRKKTRTTNKQTFSFELNLLNILIICF